MKIEQKVEVAATPAEAFNKLSDLRLLPALAGTFMVPAMYFLARQFLGRRGALLAAAFTAVSAFLNYYSRDAKMYEPTWRW